MASLRGLLQGLLDKTTLDEKVSNAFRPKMISPSPGPIPQRTVQSRPVVSNFAPLRSLQNKFQQAELAKINYQRESNQGLPGQRLMKYPILNIGANQADYIGRTIVPQGIKSLGNLASPKLNPLLTHNPQLPKGGDIYNATRLAALPFTFGSQQVAGAMNVGMKGIQNKLQGKPFIDKYNYGRTFAEGAGQGSVYGAASKLNPITFQALENPIIRSGLANTIKQITSRAGLQALRQLPENIGIGAIRPTNQGESRKAAIINDTILGSLTAAATQSGGDLLQTGFKGALEAFSKTTNKPGIIRYDPTVRGYRDWATGKVISVKEAMRKPDGSVVFTFAGDKPQKTTSYIQDPGDPNRLIFDPKELNQWLQENAPIGATIKAQPPKGVGESLDDMLDINRKPTGWKQQDIITNQKEDLGIRLINPQTGEYKNFTYRGNSGTELLRAKMKAQAYAIDNPIAPKPIGNSKAEIITKPLYQGQTPAPKGVGDKYIKQLEFARKYPTYNDFKYQMEFVGGGSAEKSRMIQNITRDFGSLENFWRTANGKQPKISSRNLGLNSQPYLKPKGVGDKALGNIKTTIMADEARYITQEGKWISPEMGSHAQIAQRNLGRLENPMNAKDISDYMFRSGDVRVNVKPSSVNVEFLTIPTQTQLKSIEKMAEGGKTIFFDINDGTGKYLESGSVKNVNDLRKVLSKYYGPTIAPKGVGEGWAKAREAVANDWQLADKQTKGVGEITKATNITQPNIQPGKLPQAPETSFSSPKILSENPNQLAPSQKLPTNQTVRISKPTNQPLEDIIAEGRKQIGTAKPDVNKSIRQVFSDAYTQWVDRYNPLVKASQKAKSTLESKGAVLRPENDPEHLVRRLTGAGGIADARFRNELEPIIKQADQLKIPKADLDVYLANKRIAGFGQAGREVYGADPIKAQQIVQALESKYGQNITGIADQLYAYQNKGFQEMVDAGFISPEAAATIKSQNPDYSPLYRVMDDVNDYLGLPTRKTMQGSQPIVKIKGSTRQIESPLESIMGNTFSQRAAIEKNRVAKSLVGLQQVADMGFTPASKSGSDTITIWNNGQKEYWNVGKDIADVAKGVNEESMNVVLKIIQAPAALLRQGATGRNPEFMIPNIIRDQLDAGVTSKYGYIPFVDYASGVIEVGKKDFNTVFGTKFNTEVYDKWANSGAKIDLGEMSGRKSMAKYFDEARGKRNLFNWVSSGLDLMGRYSEQPTRVGLFKKAYNKTGNDLIAMMESRDSTVDFARMGSKMKVANSIIPFLNVGVQGFDKLIRAVKDHPSKVLFNATLYGVAPAAAVTAYNLSNYPEEYAEIPQYEKDGNFVLVKGRNANGTVDYVTFPKGNVLPTITNPVQSLMEFTAKNSQQTFSEMATSLISSTLPVIGDGQSLNEVALKTIGSNMPQAIKPAAENLLNKSFYKYNTKKEQTKEIVPNYLQNKPAYQQTYEFTPQMYQKIGAVLNASPLKVQNLMEGYLAGYSKIPSQTVEMLTKISRGEEVSPNEKTILRRFVKQTYPGGETKPKVTPEVPGLMERVMGKASAADTSLALPETQDDLKVLYKDADQIIKNYNENKVKAKYGLVDKTIEEYQGEVDEAIAMKKKIEKEKPDMVFDIELDMYDKDGGATIDERVKWIGEKIGKADNPEEMLNKLYEANALTKSVVEALNEEYDLDITKYNYGDGYRYLSGGKKGKKIKIKKATTAKRSSIKMPSFKSPSTPALKLSKPSVGKLKVSPVNTKIATSKIRTTIKQPAKLRMSFA